MENELNPIEEALECWKAIAKFNLWAAIWGWVLAGFFLVVALWEYRDKL